MCPRSSSSSTGQLQTSHNTLYNWDKRKKRRWQGDVLHQSGCFTFFTSAKHRPVSEPERVLLVRLLITTTNLTIHLFHPYYISFIDLHQIKFDLFRLVFGILPLSKRSQQRWRWKIMKGESEWHTVQLPQCPSDLDSLTFLTLVCSFSESFSAFLASFSSCLEVNC